MLYFLLVLSLTANGVLVWYVKKLLQKYWFDVEVREKFTEMLGQYADSLKSLYRLEELYGEETIKRAIVQTEFVVEACKEFKEAIDNEAPRGEEREEDEGAQSEETSRENSVITLREGERITQSAASYKRVVTE